MSLRRKQSLGIKGVFTGRVAADGGVIDAATCSKSLDADFINYPIAYKAGTLYNQRRAVKEGDIGYPASADDFTVVRALTQDRVDKDGNPETMLANIPVLDYDDGASGVLGCPMLVIDSTNVTTVDGAGDAASINSIEGVIYFRGQAESTSATKKYIRISDGTASNKIEVGYNGNNIEVNFTVGGVVDNSIGTIGGATTLSRIAIKYTEDLLELWIDGSKSGEVARTLAFPEGTTL